LHVGGKSTLDWAAAKISAADSAPAARPPHRAGGLQGPTAPSPQAAKDRARPRDTRASTLMEWTKGCSRECDPASALPFAGLLGCKPAEAPVSRQGLSATGF